MSIDPPNLPGTFQADLRGPVPSRRDFLRCVAAAGGLPLVLGGCAGGLKRSVEISPPWANDPLGMSSPFTSPPAAADAANLHLYDAPDLSDGRVIRFVAGIRPYRTGRIRIEIEEESGGRCIIHNYGHGGAGVTLSWGSAEEVVRLVRSLVEDDPRFRHAPSGAKSDSPLEERGYRNPDSGPHSHAEKGMKIAVLGAGVIGLTAAHDLLRAGFSVRLYARATTTQTTSHLAGAQWAPSLVARGCPEGDPEFFTRLVRTSHRRFRAMLGSAAWGVFERPNFDGGAGAGGGGLSHIPRDLIPPVRHIDPLPIAGMRKAGRVYQTMIIEPPIFLPRLMREIEMLGGTFEERTFNSIEDVVHLDERLIVNCLGLGAREITDDPRIVPMRGQLVHLEPQNLPYLLSHDDGYIFPRHDAVLIGGTMERGVDDPTPSEASCRRILERNRRFFA